MQSRINLISAINSRNVTKAGGRYTVRDVTVAVDEIVMNGGLYPAEELAASAKQLSGLPAPAGHPRDERGRAISATNGRALVDSWIGAYCTNARHESGRTLVDMVIDEQQAKAKPAGEQLVKRLDAALNGESIDPIHVSTGLLLNKEQASGKSNGKAYSWVARGLQYDHVAILLNERGAGTPADGVGMWLNSDGSETPIEVATVTDAPEDKRQRGLIGWLMGLLGNSAELSFDDIHQLLNPLLPDGAWLREIYTREMIYTDRESRMWRVGYAISDRVASLVGEPVEVRRVTKYEPIENGDQMKSEIVAALNAAGINSAGLDDSQMLAAYNDMIRRPVQERLNTANSKIAEAELAANAARDAELTELATALAVNSSLTVDDLKRLGLDRLKSLAASKPAAPVVPALNAAAMKSWVDAAPYDLNKLEA